MRPCKLLPCAFFPLLFASVMLAGCSSSQSINGDQIWMSGYTCCNLRYIEGDNWISDGNYTSYPFIPAGAPIMVAVRSNRDYRTNADIHGSRYRFGHDYSRRVESFESWLKGIVVSENPRAKMEAWPPEIQRTIRDGRIRIGMTKEQVLMSLGSPLKTKTPDLSYPIWHYWHTEDSEYFVHWESGKVSKVTRRVASVADVIVDGKIENE